MNLMPLRALKRSTTTEPVPAIAMEFVGVGARVLEHILRRLGFKAGVREQEGGRFADQGNRREIFHSVIRHLGGVNRRARMKHIHQHQRVAISSRLGHVFRANHPARAAFVIHHHALLEHLAQLVCNQAPRAIGATAGREGHHNLDRLARKLLRECARAACEQSAGNGERKQFAAVGHDAEFLCDSHMAV